jgi:hypothetical protein
VRRRDTGELCNGVVVAGQSFCERHHYFDEDGPADALLSGYVDPPLDGEGDGDEVKKGQS